jgi:hypothetical protein
VPYRLETSSRLRFTRQVHYNIYDFSLIATWEGYYPGTWLPLEMIVNEFVLLSYLKYCATTFLMVYETAPQRH